MHNTYTRYIGDISYTQDISGIFTSHISDHQAIFTSTNTRLLKYGEKQYIHIETKDDESLSKFINEQWRIGT